METNTHDTTLVAPEVKSSGFDIAQEFESLRHSFEAYKETNDERVSDIKKNGSVDVITQEKLNRIDANLNEAKANMDRAELKSRRPAFAHSENH